MCANYEYVCFRHSSFPWLNVNFTVQIFIIIVIKLLNRFFRSNCKFVTVAYTGSACEYRNGKDEATGVLGCMYWWLSTEKNDFWGISDFQYWMAKFLISCIISKLHTSKTSVHLTYCSLLQLFTDVAPKTAENFRALCTGLISLHILIVLDVSIFSQGFVLCSCTQ